MFERFLSQRKKKVGFALGGGSARGWSHVGVLRALEERGIVPDVVCGTSAGALVGAAYVLGRLDDFERWLGSLEWRDVVGYLDFTVTGGVIRGRRLFEFFASRVEDRNIEDLSIPFGAVATDLEDGSEIWLRQGSLMEAVRASISVPALLKPVQIGNRWCVDGGLVNPVPVSLCRALGAEIVIAVDVNDGLLSQERPLESLTDSQEAAPAGTEPSLFEVVERSLHIAQSRLTRSRLALDPPEVLITPEVAHIGFLEFHRAKDCFGCGRKAVEVVEAELMRRHLGKLVAAVA
jgi:NTE family protein